MRIDWDKSYILTAEQVALLGLEGVSVAEVDTKRDIRKAARTAEAIERVTV